LVPREVRMWKSEGWIFGMDVPAMRHGPRRRFLESVPREWMTISSRTSHSRRPTVSGMMPMMRAMSPRKRDLESCWVRVVAWAMPAPDSVVKRTNDPIRMKNDDGRRRDGCQMESTSRMTRRSSFRMNSSAVWEAWITVPWTGPVLRLLRLMLLGRVGLWHGSHRRDARVTLLATTGWVLEGGRGVEDFEVRVAFAEEAEGPFRAEEDDWAVGGVDGEDGVAGVVDGGFGDWGAVFVLEPADVGPGCGFEAGFGVVFGEEPVLDDFELERADGAEEGDAASGVRLAEVLDDAFFEELVEAFAESFGVGDG